MSGEREPWFDAPASLMRECVEYLVERSELEAAVRGMTGLSSDAMVRAALTGVGPYTTDFPRDRADWRRCLLAYALAPTWLRDRMRPIMRAYRARLDTSKGWWTHPVKSPSLAAALSCRAALHREIQREAAQEAA